MVSSETGTLTCPGDNGASLLEGGGACFVRVCAAIDATTRPAGATPEAPL